MEKGERLIEHGRGVEAISLILQGRVQVTKDNNVLGELGAGKLVEDLRKYVAELEESVAASSVLSPT
jgi:5-deoxy-D-glucuronate isomerase